MGATPHLLAFGREVILDDRSYNRIIERGYNKIGCVGPGPYQRIQRGRTPSIASTCCKGKGLYGK